MIGGAGPRRFGRRQGQVRMSTDFDAPMPDAELAAWTEEHAEPDEVVAASGEPVT